ncbi:hypothetical protein [Streptomyces carpinensis]|uniref:hypothetical protein n=1 Tax=Streptomyces carpinensis TaxID=66369 RepID=UPI003CC5485F
MSVRRSTAASADDGAQAGFVVDGVAGPTVTVPGAGGWRTCATVGAIWTCAASADRLWGLPA